VCGRWNLRNLRPLQIKWREPGAFEFVRSLLGGGPICKEHHAAAPDRVTRCSDEHARSDDQLDRLDHTRVARTDPHASRSRIIITFGSTSTETTCTRTHHWLSTTWMREVACPRNSLCTLVSRLELNAQTQRAQLELRSHTDDRDSLRRGAPRESARTPSKTSTSTSENLEARDWSKPNQSARTHPAGPPHSSSRCSRAGRSRSSVP